MTFTYHETRGAPRRRGLDLPLSAKQRAAAQLLRDHLKAGRVNKSELMEALWGDQPVQACSQGCDCEDCQSGKCPHTRRNTRMHTHDRKPIGKFEIDPRQLVADLISDDASPFVPDDEMSLRAMSFDTLSALHGRYLDPSGTSRYRANTAQEEIARRRNNSHVQALYVRHPDGYYVDARDLAQPAGHVNSEVEAEDDDEAIAAMTFGHDLHAKLTANATRARDLRKAKAKKAGHDAKAWTKDSPYTPDDEEAARGGEEVEDHQAVIRQQASAAMATRNRRSQVRTR